MAYRRFCDRCGKDIGEIIQTDDNELHFTKKRKTRFGYDKQMHLCDDCLKDFNKFIMVKKNG